MSKHFEELWNESEEIALLAFKDHNVKVIADEAATILNYITEMDPSQYEDEIGDVLFKLCYVCNKLRINSYSSLFGKLNEYKIDTFEPDLSQ